MEQLNASYSKTEKLKSKKLISWLFESGKSVVAYPLKLVFLETHFDDGVLLKTGFSISKRNFKKAVDRNRIKRLMREAYRLNKAGYFGNTSKHYAFMILYLDKEIPDFKLIDSKMKSLFKKFKEKVD